MKNLQVTAYMADGRVFSYDGIFNLDSLLAWSWMWENYPDQMENGNPLKDELIEPNLPLEKRGGGEDWYWACSIGQHEVLKEQISYWHRRTDVEDATVYVDFGKRKGKIVTKSGAYKPYRMPITEKLIDRIDWYCVGDEEKIAHLLCRVGAIGKKTAQGFGQVSRWKIKEVDEDKSYLRPIPATEAIKKGMKGEMHQLGIRPPYWHKQNQRVVMMPI